MRTAIASVILSLLLSPVFGFSITSKAPGNLFSANEKVVLTLTDASGSVTWKLNDLKGNQLKSGSTEAPYNIDLGKLAPGYYELTCSSGDTNTTSAIGVVASVDLDKDSRGRVGVDVAMAWCIPKEQWKDAATMVRMSGIKWVRERIAWGGVEPGKGSFNWTNYDEVADLLHSEGLNISQVMDFAPQWSFENNPGPAPQDLTGVYRFLKAAVDRYKGKIQAWEMWNEVDKGWPTLGDTYSAELKAAYLGAKDADPDVLVLPSSFSAHTMLPFAANMGECQVQDYFDVLDLHRYHEPRGHASTVKAYNSAVQNKSKPVWLTETNLLLWPSEGNNKKLLGHVEQLRACRYIPRAAATLLSSGLERIFFFMLPDRPEGDVQFGLLRPDLTPYPSFIALATAARILGNATSRGALKLPSGATAYSFDTPKGRVTAAWSDKPMTIDLLVTGKSIEIVDMLGASTQLNTTKGKIAAAISPDPIYIIEAGNIILPVSAVKTAYKSPCRIVIAPRSTLKALKPRNWYLISDQPVEFAVEVFNLNPNQACKGSMSVQLPKGWQCDPKRQDMELEPMGRKVITYNISPSGSGLGPYKVKFTGDFGEAGKTVMVSHFGRDIANAGSGELVSLDNALPKWETAVQGVSGQVSVEPQGDHEFWVRPVGSEIGRIRIVFESTAVKSLDISKADAVEMLVNASPKPDGLSTRLYMTDWRGAGWEFWESPSGNEDLKAFMLQDVDWQWWTEPYIVPGFEKIKSLRLAVEFNAPFKSFKLSINKVAAARFPTVNK
jgi:hypothetical protein